MLTLHFIGSNHDQRESVAVSQFLLTMNCENALGGEAQRTTSGVKQGGYVLLGQTAMGGMLYPSVVGNEARKCLTGMGWGLAFGGVTGYCAY
ncbi:hypothetical protein E2P81_ATG01503 [Venturia nashicola]|uniref:Uncharacterized protein n=1 Tax=Venturia nashicola TaxID=86259 RepID=A0A4Z1PUU6_9PEZI|nr:hypothetical protein E6O75_ATG01540 [Venturia nashicola]TLD38960.1 hypothetical protein E2P81_ATG01503 [Venturia nashicola]